MNDLLLRILLDDKSFTKNGVTPNTSEENEVSKGHVHGGNVTTTHSTVTDATQKVVDVASKMAAIKRISLGKITRALGGSHRISIKSQSKGAIVLTVRMPQSIQEVTLFTDSIDFVLCELRKKLAIK